MMESMPGDNVGDRISNRVQHPVTLGDLIDAFISSSPPPLYKEALARPVVRRYLVDYVLTRVRWELPPELLRVDDTHHDVAIRDAMAFREYVECAIYWGMEEIIRDRLDLSLTEDDYLC